MRWFAHGLTDLVYALDLSLPQSSGGGEFAKAPEAIDGPVDITVSSGRLDLRDRGQGRVDVTFKAGYKGTVIFGPNTGKRVKGKIKVIAREARHDT